MGFSYTKRNSKLYVYEQQDVIESRHTYLHNIKKLCVTGSPIVYTNETQLTGSGLTVMARVGGSNQVGRGGG